MLGLVIVTALAGYILVKYGRRRLFLKKLGTAPVSPEALKRRLDAGDDVTIVDLRTALDVAATPYAIRGPAGCPPTPSTSMRSSSSALGMLCSTAPHPTTRRAPGWRFS
jgi:hypothetical protein